MESLGRVRGVLNRGGRAEEKVLEAREFLAEGRGLLDVAP